MLTPRPGETRQQVTLGEFVLGIIREPSKSIGSVSSAADRWAAESRRSPPPRPEPTKSSSSNHRGARGRERNASPPPWTAPSRRQADPPTTATRRSAGSPSPPSSKTWPTASSSSGHRRGRERQGKVFAQLDEIVTDPDAVLASNTSSIPIEDRRGHQEPAAGARAALLQPGAGAAARRTGQHPGHQ